NPRGGSSMQTKVRESRRRTGDTPKPAGGRPASSRKDGNGAQPQDPMAVVLAALVAMRDGDFSTRLPSDWTGIEGKVADAFNEIVQSSRRMEQELQRIGETVGRQGKTRQRASFTGRGGA